MSDSQNRTGLYTNDEILEYWYKHEDVPADLDTSNAQLVLYELCANPRIDSQLLDKLREMSY